MQILLEIVLFGVMLAYKCDYITHDVTNTAPLLELDSFNWPSTPKAFKVLVSGASFKKQILTLNLVITSYGRRIKSIKKTFSQVKEFSGTYGYEI